MTNFCTSEVKKFMMVKADGARGKGLFRMKQAWKRAVTVAFIGTMACSPLAMAQDGIPRTVVKYEAYQDPSFDPAYTIAWDAMAALYKGSEYEKGNPYGQNPYLDVGQIDLNGDQMDEIIAVPVPAYPESVQLCTVVNQICPYYILEVRDKTVHTLGIIKAALIDRGNDVQNGYWTLKVYQRDKNGEYTKPSEYIYDRKKDGYVPNGASSKSSVAPKPSAPASKP
jgi:hypothetical protein